MKTTHVLLLTLLSFSAAIPVLAGDTPDVLVLRRDDTPGTCNAGVNCTLRQAVAYIDSLNLSRPGILSLSSGPYNLTIPDVPGTAGVNRGSIKINTDIKILGDRDPGEAPVTIDAFGLSRHFDVGIGKTLTLENITLQNGRPADRAPGANGTPGTPNDPSTADGGNGATGLQGKNGGSIHVGENGQLFCTEVTFIDNQAGRGSDGGAGGMGALGLIGSTGNGGSGGSGSRGGSGGALHGDVSSEITLDCCTFIRNVGGAGGTGGEGGAGGSGQFNGGSGGDGGAAGSGGHGGAINHRGMLNMVQSQIRDCESGPGGNGGEGGNGAGLARGGEGGRGGDAGGGGGIALSFLDAGEQHLQKCSIESCRTARGGNGGNGGSGGLIGIGGSAGASGGDAGRNGQGGLVYAVLSSGQSTYEDCALESGSIGESGVPGTASSGSGGEGQTLVRQNAGAGLFVGVDMDMSRCSITDCDAGMVDAGGIYHDRGNLRLASCTLADNRADRGGALYARGLGSVHINQGTIAQNTATSAFGAIGGPLDINLRSTLIIDNASPPVTFDVRAWASDGYNMIDNADTAPGLATDAVGPGSTGNVMLPTLFPAIPFPAHYRMPDASQTVDAGRPPVIIVPGGDPFLDSDADILGMPRFMGNRTDVGSTENAGSVEIRIEGCQRTSGPFGAEFIELTVSANQTPMPLILATAFEAQILDFVRNSAGSVAGPGTGTPIAQIATAPLTTFTIQVGGVGSSAQPIQFHVVSSGVIPPLRKFSQILARPDLTEAK